MRAKRRRVRKGRPRPPIPKTLPDDLYDCGDGPAPRFGAPRESALHVVDVEKLPIIDDWPEKVPITEEEIDIFERYFGDVLDHLFGPIDDLELGLKLLSQSDNEKP